MSIRNDILRELESRKISVYRLGRAAEAAGICSRQMVDLWLAGRSGINVDKAERIAAILAGLDSKE